MPSEKIKQVKSAIYNSRVLGSPGIYYMRKVGARISYVNQKIQDRLISNNIKFPNPCLDLYIPLIHGVYDDAHWLKEFQEKIELKLQAKLIGQPVNICFERIVFDDNYDRNRGINHFVQELAEKIQLQSLYGKTIIPIGHSMGGLLATAYASRYGVNHNSSISKVITICSPFYGSKFGKIKLLGKALEELHPNSIYLAGLREHMTNLDIPIHHYAAEFDIPVKLESSLPFLAPYSTRTIIPACDHADILKKELLADLIVEDILSSLALRTRYINYSV